MSKRQKLLTLVLLSMGIAASPADSAAQVCPGTVIGDYKSAGDLLGFGIGCDVVTFDHEHVPGAQLAVLPECYTCIAMPGVFSRPIAAPEAESWLMMALRARTLPPLLRRFVDVVDELNRSETAVPELVPSKARKSAPVSRRTVKAR